MNKQQFLLLKLSEECAEVAQRCSKQIQFGKLEMQKDQDLTNGERLKREILDMLAIIRLLQNELEIPTWSDYEFDKAKKDKIAKINKYLVLSEKEGQISGFRI